MLMQIIIPSISGLVTNAALTAVKNKIPNIKNLVKKTDYDSKISDMGSKYISTTDYNKLLKILLLIAKKVKA